MFPSFEEYLLLPLPEEDPSPYVNELTNWIYGPRSDHESTHHHKSNDTPLSLIKYQLNPSMDQFAPYESFLYSLEENKTQQENSPSRMKQGNIGLENNKELRREGVENNMELERDLVRFYTNNMELEEGHFSFRMRKKNVVLMSSKTI